MQVDSCLGSTAVATRAVFVDERFDLFLQNLLCICLQYCGVFTLIFKISKAGLRHESQNQRKAVDLYFWELFQKSVSVHDSNPVDRNIEKGTNFLDVISSGKLLGVLRVFLPMLVYRIRVSFC